MDKIQQDLINAEIEINNLKAQIKILKKRLHTMTDGATLILKASLTLNEGEIKQFWNR